MVTGWEDTDINSGFTTGDIVRSMNSGRMQHRLGVIILSK
jgi:hypothetical protein